MPSDNRIILSNCLTVILHDDMLALLLSFCLRRLYSSTINSEASALIYKIKMSKNDDEIEGLLHFAEFNDLSNSKSKNNINLNTNHDFRNKISQNITIA